MAKTIQPTPTEPAAPVTIAIIDDHPVMVSFLTQLLEQQGKYKVVGRADTAAGALELCRRVKPALIILDLTLIDTNGLDCLRELRRECPRSRVLVFTGRLNHSLVAEMLEIGAGGIMGKAARVQSILDGVERVAQGGIYLCPQSCDMVRTLVASSPPDRTKRPELSRQELTVLQHIAGGLGTRQIAAKMELSPNTINAFRGRLMRKTGLHSTAHLVLYAARLGLVRVPGLRVATINPLH